MPSYTRRPGSRAWDIYWDGELYDTVWFVRDMSGLEVCRSLVEHDNYPPSIVAVLDNESPVWCDNDCGQLGTEPVSSLPRAVATAHAGESAVLCMDCYREVME